MVVSCTNQSTKNEHDVFHIKMSVFTTDSGPKSSVSVMVSPSSDLVSKTSSTYGNAVKDDSNASAQDSDDSKGPAQKVANRLHEITSGFCGEAYLRTAPLFCM